MSTGDLQGVLCLVRVPQLTHQVCAAACDATVNDLSIVIDGSVADLQAHMGTSCGAADLSKFSTVSIYI